MKHAIRFALALAALGLCTPPAYADAVDELAAGSSICFDQLTLTTEDGQRLRAGLCTDKSPSTLDFDAPARALGLLSDEVLHFAGTRRGGEVRWTVAHHFAAPIPYINLTHIDAVRAVLVVAVTPLPAPTRLTFNGIERHFSVGLEERPGTTVELHVVGPFYDRWQLTTNAELRGQAGLLPPPLRSFAMEAGAEIRTRSVPQTRLARLTLAAPAPFALMVAIRSSNPGLVAPDAILVPRGRSTLTFPLRIAASAVGAATVTAALGNSQQSLAIRVRARPSCVAFAYEVRDLEPICASCEAVALGPSRMILTTGEGLAHYTPDLGLKPLNDLTRLTDVQLSPLIASGRFIARGTTATGELLSLIFDPERLSRPTTVSGVSLSAVNDQDVAVGGSAGPFPKALVHVAGRAVELPLDGSIGSAVAIDVDGLVAGNLTQQQQQVGFLLAGDTVETVGGMGKRVHLQALNESREAVGAMEEDGRWTAFRYRQGDKTPTSLGAFDGYPHSVASAINNDGCIGGSAFKEGNGPTLPVALLSDGERFVSVQSRVRAARGAAFESVLAVTDDGRLLVRARVAGELKRIVLDPSLHPGNESSKK